MVRVDALGNGQYKVTVDASEEQALAKWADASPVDMDATRAVKYTAAERLAHVLAGALDERVRHFRAVDAQRTAEAIAAASPTVRAQIDSLLRNG